MFRSSKDVGSLAVEDPECLRVRERSATEEYGCDICTDGGWWSETEVELHKSKVHFTAPFMNKLQQANDYCRICIKKFTNRINILKHIRTEHLLSSECSLRVEREIFVCDSCGDIFFNKQHLVIHSKYRHDDMTNVTFVECVLCARRIRVRNILAHFYLHDIQSVSTCRICLRKCRNTKHLKDHLKTHPYYLKCEMCHYDTSNLNAFQNHIFTTHKNIARDAHNDDIACNDKVGDKSIEGLKAISDSFNTDDDSVDDMMGESDYITVIEICDDNPSQIDTNLDDTSQFNPNIDGTPQINVNVNDIPKPNQNVSDMPLLNLNTHDMLQLIENINDSSLNKKIDEIPQINTDLQNLNDQDDIKTQPIDKQIIEKLTTDNLSLNRDSKEINDDFERYFIPKVPALVKFQRIVGVKGMKLSNNVRICVLCREICVSVDNMKRHVLEHKIIKSRMENLYVCSCGERFSSKLLLKYHAFKTKHVTEK